MICLAEAPPTRDVYSVDFESFYRNKKGASNNVSIGEQGGWHYLRHPEMDIYLVTIIGPNGKRWQGRPEDFDWDSIGDQEFVSHNAGFDTLVYERLKELFPEMLWPDPHAWHCTADLAAYLGYGRSLQEAGKQLLGVKVSKDYRATMNGKYVRDLDERELKQMQDAGFGDAESCRDIWTKYSPRWPEKEQRLSLLTRQMGWRGVMVDPAGLEAAKTLLGQMLWNAQIQIPWSGQKDEKGKDIPLLSAKMVGIKCREEHIEPPASMAKDDPLFDSWLDTYGEVFPWVKSMSEYRRINTKHERVITMIDRIMPNGRMAYAWKYAGAHTLRWAGDGGMNVQNQDKLPFFVENLSIVRDTKRFADLIEMVDLGLPMPEGVQMVDMRGLIVAPPGKAFIICDLSQIEPRCLWWLTDNKAAMKLAADGMSPYEVHARGSMGWLESDGDLKFMSRSQARAKKLYALAKARVLALGYGAGWHKFYGMALSYGVSPTIFEEPLEDGAMDRFVQYLTKLKTKEQLRLFEAADDLMKLRYTNAWLIVLDFRYGNEEIVELWDFLQAGFQNSKNGDYELELPSRRSLIYRNVQSLGGWSAEVVKNGHFARTRIYGGKLCENITQATARDVFGEAKLRVIDEGYEDLVLSVHDEGVWEVDEDVAEQARKEIEELMSITPEWLKGCPIGAEAKISKVYLK